MFRSHAEADIVELQRISDILKNKKRLDNIDIQTALSIFDGHSIFSIFSREEKFHEQILLQL